MKKQACENSSCRLGKVGGQAVIEGVMMKAGERTVTTCRKEDGSLVVTEGSFVSVRKKHKFLNIPLLRGVINFIEMMILSVKILGISAEALDLEGEENKKTKEGKKKESRLIGAIMTIATVLGLALCVVLFIYLPNLFTDLISSHVRLGMWEAVIEGLFKILIFIIYLLLVSLMKDIRRTFMYHGAEHKSIACFEAGDELTPKNAMKHRRFHPRCGTSFMFFMILIGIIAGLFVRIIFKDIGTFAYTAIRIALLPLVMGIGYEIIMLAGKHNNVFTRILSAPGLWVQRITTKEPSEDMLEVAIISLKCALSDEYPEFEQFRLARPWEPKAEENPESEAAPTNSAEEATESEAAPTNGDEEATEPEATPTNGNEEATEPEESLGKNMAVPSIPPACDSVTEASE